MCVHLFHEHFFAQHYRWASFLFCILLKKCIKVTQRTPHYNVMQVCSKGYHLIKSVGHMGEKFKSSWSRAFASLLENKFRSQLRYAAGCIPRCDRAVFQPWTKSLLLAFMYTVQDALRNTVPQGSTVQWWALLVSLITLQNCRHRPLLL